MDTILWIVFFACFLFVQFLSSGRHQACDEREGMLGFIKSDIRNEVARGAKMVRCSLSAVVVTFCYCVFRFNLFRFNSFLRRVDVCLL